MVGQFDYDEGVYWESLRAIRTGHPLFTSVFSSQPPAFLLLVQPVWAALGGSIAAARAVMLIFGIVSVLSGALLGHRLLGTAGAVGMAGLLALDPLMLRQSVVLEAEGPAICLSLLSLALAAVSMTTPRRRIADVTAVASGAAIAIGILTKLFDVAALPPLAAMLILYPHTIRNAVMVTMGAAVAGTAVLVPLYGALGPMWQQVVAMHLDIPRL